MANLIIKEKTNKQTEIIINLFLIKYKDNDNIYYVYSPHFELSGYGKTEKEAEESFEYMLEDLIDYSIENKTLEKLLKKLGWSKKSNGNSSPLKVNSILNKSEVNEIFDNYSVNTYHQKIEIPSN